MQLILVVRSAEIFKNFTILSKMHLYAVASVVNGPSSSPPQSTMVDTRGGATPFWWFTMEFEINGDETLAIHVKCQRSLIMGSHKTVGLLHVPVKALLDYDSAANIALPILSKSAKTRGVLYMSCVLGDRAPTPRPAPSAPPLEDCEEYGRYYYCAPVAAVVPSAPYLTTEEIMLH